MTENIKCFLQVLTFFQDANVVNRTISWLPQLPDQLPDDASPPSFNTNASEAAIIAQVIQNFKWKKKKKKKISVSKFQDVALLKYLDMVVHVCKKWNLLFINIHVLYIIEYICIHALCMTYDWLLHPELSGWITTL